MAENIRRIIHVKGVGRASQAPDQVTISITLEAQDKDYARAVELIADKIDTLRKSVAAAGLNLNELKTEKFYVESRYDYQSHGNGTNRKFFLGYFAEHRLEITIDFENAKFNNAVVILTDCPADPEIRVSFSVKDVTALNERLLESATKDAHHKAEILCAVSGVKLGKLLNIGCKPEDYAKGISVTDIDALLAGVVSGGMMNDEKIFIPKDVEIKDSVDFFWEIID